MVFILRRASWRCLIDNNAPETCANKTPVILQQLLLGLIGLAHAIAAWFYFSKERHAGVWAGAWLLITALSIWRFPPYPMATVVVFGAIVAAWTWWWESIPALARRHWVPEGERQARATLDGDQLLVRNLRNFTWQSSREFTARWEDRRYDMGTLEAVDMFVCTWGDPRIAHIITSFVFSDSPPLALSIETRREQHEKWSVFAGFMKSYELIIIAADERDVIRVRTNIRHERVSRYRLETTPDTRRRMLTRFIQELNDVAGQPRFYNTLYRNCTTEVISILRENGHEVPLDWRLLVTGYLPQYLYQHGLISTDGSFKRLQQTADICPLALAADADPDFSKRIRAEPRAAG